MRVSPALENHSCIASSQTSGGQTQVLIPIITAPTNIKPGADRERRDQSRQIVGQVSAVSAGSTFYIDDESGGIESIIIS